jgi:hypothetical protein
LRITADVTLPSRLIAPKTATERGRNKKFRLRIVMAASQ